MLLGWVNDRGDGPPERREGTPRSWLDDGTFLVVRKIRQFAERFDAVVEKAADALVSSSGIAHSRARELVRSKLMGRNSDGTPLAVKWGAGDNDFDFQDDPAGGQCPFASHVRRANPRAVSEGTRPPRIVRRGMAYGPPAGTGNPGAAGEVDRGVLFMAYNASIAEQFEVIQRWLTGGNSSGVSSSQRDPLLGVPRAGEPNLFLFVHEGKVIRVDLGDQPLCRLEWGLYAFVPSMAQLRSMKSPACSSPSEPPAPAAQRQRSSELQRRLASSDDPVERQQAYEALVKAEFEDETRRGLSWHRVRCNGGVERIDPTGSSAPRPAVMVGGFDAAMQVLQDDGSTFSASGYFERMEATLGPSPFGQDNAGRHRGHERDFVEDVKKAIEASVTEADAYSISYQFIADSLESQLVSAGRAGSPAASVDLIALGINLLAHLFEAWFGVDYDDGATERGGIGDNAEPVRCPGHFLSVARRVFSAYPNPSVKVLSDRDGRALKAWTTKPRNASRNRRSAPVLRALLGQLPKSASGRALSHDEQAGLVANVMLGLPATLLGSWGKVVKAWNVDRSLWRLQHKLSQAGDAPAAYCHAREVLREPLIRTMAADPVADGIWRTAMRTGNLAGVEVSEGDVVWLGLASALSEKLDDPAVAEALIFGGSRGSCPTMKAPHACPGRSMATGALLGALAALLQAGELASTANPVVLTLKPLRP